MKRSGLIVAVFGRHYEIELDGGGCITGFPLGKKSIHACGDRVELELAGADQARILEHRPRTSLLYRSDPYRQKLIAANATQLVLVVATEPAFSDELLARALVAAENEELNILIVLNKCDLEDRLQAARDALRTYAELGYPVMEMSAKRDVEPLRARLTGQLSVLVGQSGMGKSTLINGLIPGAAAATREISTALDSGKHTTTYARSYPLVQDEGRIIDSPGLQEFGLAHLTRSQIEWGFREFRPHLGRCRFRDCRHEAEPDCAVKQAAAAGAITERRLAIFRRIASSVG